jgi:hypothetical protein
MVEISNRSLVILAGIALFVTFVGASISLIKTGNMEFPLITGLATTATGKVNVTVESIVSISLPTSSVDFGNGSLTSAPSHTFVNTSATTNPSTFNEPGPLRVRNDGNVLINITINGTVPGTFLGGTDPTYAWQAAAGEGGCLTGLNTTMGNFSNTPTLACNETNFTDVTDEFNVSIFLEIPSDVAVGLKQDTVIQFSATQNPG